MSLDGRLERLEKAFRVDKKAADDAKKEDLLSHRDVCFLICERQRLQNDTTLEYGSDEKLISDVLIDRLGDMLKRYERACGVRPLKSLTPEKAAQALIRAKEVDADYEDFRKCWLERLDAKRKYIREVLQELDSLKS